jgi:hypothetical protein
MAILIKQCGNFQLCSVQVTKEMIGVESEAEQNAEVSYILPTV